jgi:hypothetical protein
MISIRLGVLLVLAGAFFVSTPKLAAEDSADEAAEAAKEEAEQKQRELEIDRPIFSYIVGTLDLKAQDQRGDANGVVAKVTAKSKEYQVKISSPGLIADLEKLDGKRVKLRGNARNKGKYFVVEAVALAGPGDK